MKLIYRWFVLLLVAATANAAESYAVHVSVKDTPGEQFALGRSLVTQALHATTDNEKKLLTATALETLEAVWRVWPAQRNYVINAAMLEAELLIATNAPHDAIRVLQRTEAIAKNGPGAAGIHLRMARAYVRLHDDASAEPLLVAAEREAPFEGSATIFAVALDLGELYTRTNHPAEVSKRFRLLAKDDHIDPTSAAFFTMRSARESLRAGDRGSAKADLEAFDRLLARAKGLGHSPTELRMHQDLEHEAKMLRSKHGLS